MAEVKKEKTYTLKELEAAYYAGQSRAVKVTRDPDYYMFSSETEEFQKFLKTLK